MIVRRLQRSKFKRFSSFLFFLVLNIFPVVPAQNVNSSSTVTNIAPNTSNTNVSANISVANPTNVNNNPIISDQTDTVTVGDGPPKVPVVNSTTADDGQTADESER